MLCIWCVNFKFVAIDQSTRKMKTKLMIVIEKLTLHQKLKTVYKKSNHVLLIFKV